MGLMASMLLCNAQTPALNSEQKQAIEKLVPYVEPAMVRSLSKYLVPNKGTLVSPVSYAFSPEDIYNALKEKYK